MAKKQYQRNLEGETREAYVRRMIAARGLTVKEFANQAGIPPSTLGGILQRGIGTAALDTVIQICDVLEMDVDTLARQTYIEDLSGIGDWEGMTKRARNLRRARYQLRYRASFLAAQLGISDEEYKRYETTLFRIPELHIRELSSVMGVPYLYLAGETDKEPIVDDLPPSILPPEEFEEYNIGRAITALREGIGLSTADLSERISKDPATVQQWERRERVPTDYDLAALCQALSTEQQNVTLEAFYQFPIVRDFTDKEVDLVRRYREAGEREQKIIDLLLGI